ncbi:hypothetical protein MHB47_11355 [Staphylococcus sp. FSL K6-3157]
MTKLRFTNGKVIEKRAHYDRYDVLEQLGMDVDKYVQQYVKEAL